MFKKNVRVAYLILKHMEHLVHVKIYGLFRKLIEILFYVCLNSGRMQNVHRWPRTCTIEVTQDITQAREAPKFLTI